MNLSHKAKKSGILIALFCALVLTLGLALGLPKIERMVYAEVSSADQLKQELQNVDSKKTIQLTGSITEAVELDYSGTHEVTIDLNNQTITGKVTVKGTGSLTIKNGTIQGPGSNYVIENHGNLTLGESLTVKNSEETPATSSLVANKTGATLTIKNGNYTSDFIVVKNESTSTLTIENGTFTGNKSETRLAQAVQNWGTADLNGGTYTGVVATLKMVSELGNGETGGVTRIAGGTYDRISGYFATNDDDIAYENVAKDSQIRVQGEITVKDIPYSEYLEANFAAAAEGDDGNYKIKEVEGGAEAEVPSSVVAYYTKENEDKQTNWNFSVGYRFTTYEEAVKYVNAHKESTASVTLLKDLNKDVVIQPEGSMFTLNLNGYTVTGQSSNAITVKKPSNAATVYIQSSSRGEGKVVAASGHAAVKVETGANAYVGGSDKVTLTGDGKYYVVENHGTLNLYGSGLTVNNTGTNATSSLVANKTNGTLTIDKGTYTSDFIAIKNESNLTIKRGTFNGNDTETHLGQAVQNWGTAELKGGTYTGIVATLKEEKDIDSPEAGGVTRISGGSYDHISGYLGVNDVAYENVAKNSQIRVQGQITVKDIPYSEYLESNFAASYSNNKFGIKEADATVEASSSVEAYRTQDSEGKQTNWLFNVTYKFDSFASALAYAKEKKTAYSIKLLENITEGIEIDSSVTLSLNGKTVSNTNGDAITIKKGEDAVEGSVMINGTVGGGTITGSNGHAAVKIEEGAKAQIGGSDSVTISGEGSSAYVIDNAGTLEFYGSGMKVSHSSSATKALIHNGSEGNITFERGTYTSNGASVLENEGTATIGAPSYPGATQFRGGTFSRTDSSSDKTPLIENKSGTLTVKAGTFKGTTCVVLTNETGAEVVIDGGTFSETGDAAVSVRNFGSATIQGGTFNGEVESLKKESAQDTLLTVKKGTFNDDIVGYTWTSESEEQKDNPEGIITFIPDKENEITLKSLPSADYFMDGYIAVNKDDSSGKYTVVEGEYAAKIADDANKTKVGYQLVSEALEKAKENEIIELDGRGTTEHITVSFDSMTAKNITFDIDGNLTHSFNHTIEVSGTGTLTITGHGHVDNTAEGKAALEINNGAKVEIKGEAEATARGIVQVSGSTVAFTHSSTKGYAIENAGDLTIKDVEVASEDTSSPVIVNKKEGKLNIEGGTFGAEENTSAVVENRGTASIEGGTFNGEVSAVTSDEAEEGVKLNVQGGTFNGKITGYTETEGEKKETVLKDVIEINPTEGKEVKFAEVEFLPATEYFAEGKVPQVNTLGEIEVVDQGESAAAIIAKLSLSVPGAEEANTTVMWVETLAGAAQKAAELTPSDNKVEIQLLKEVTENVVFEKSDNEITLNLFGHKLTGKNGSHAIKVEKEATVIVVNDSKDSTSLTTVAVEAGTSAEITRESNVYTIKNEGTLTLGDKEKTNYNDFKVTSTQESGIASMIDNSGTLTIYGGTYDNANKAARPALKNEPEGTFTIEGGTFSGQVQVYGNGTIKNGTFSNGVFSAYDGNVEENRRVGKLTIDGGTFSNYVYSLGELTINGGTIKNVLVRDDYGNSAATVTITGGTFEESVKSYFGSKYQYHEGAIKVDPAEGKEIKFEKEDAIPDARYFTDPTDVPIKGDDNKFVCGGSGEQKKEAHARINNVGYVSLSEAINAVEGEDKTVTLQTDVTEDVTINASKKLTIDLNGHTLKGTGSKVVITVELSATVTIIGDSGKIEGKGGHYVILNKGTLTLGNEKKEHVGFTVDSAEGSSSSSTIDNQGTLKIYGGTYLNSNNPKLAAVKNELDATVDIYGGTFGNQQTHNSGQLQLYGTATLHDGTFTSVQSSYYNGQAGKVTIKGGTYSDYIYVVGEVTIEGGTFQSNVLVWNALGSENPKLTVKGGTFEQKIQTYVEGGTGYTTEYQDGWITIDPDDGKNITFKEADGIPNAQYFTDPKDIPVKNGNGEFVSGGKDNSAVAHIGHIGYKSLKDAIEAAQNDDIVVYAGEDEITTAVVVNRSGVNFTIDLNEKNIKLSGSDNLKVENGTVTVKNGTIDHSANDGKSAVVVEEGATLTLDGVTVKMSANSENTLKYYLVVNKGTLTLNNTTVTTGISSDYTQTPSASLVQTFGNLTIEGTSKLEKARILLKVEEEGKVTIEGGTFGNGSDTIYAAVFNWGDVTINGGTFDGDVASGSIRSDGKDVASHLDIKNGTFNGKVFAFNYGSAPSLNSLADVEIEGGTFKNIEKLTSEDMEVEYVLVSENGNYTVKSKSDAQSNIVAGRSSTAFDANKLESGYTTYYNRNTHFYYVINLSSFKQQVIQELTDYKNALEATQTYSQEGKDKLSSILQTAQQHINNEDVKSGEDVITHYETAKNNMDAVLNQEEEEHFTEELNAAKEKAVAEFKSNALNVNSIFNDQHKLVTEKVTYIQAATSLEDLGYRLTEAENEVASVYNAMERAISEVKFYALFHGIDINDEEHGGHIEAAVAGIYTADSIEEVDNYVRQIEAHIDQHAEEDAEAALAYAKSHVSDALNAYIEHTHHEDYSLDDEIQAIITEAASQLQNDGSITSIDQFQEKLATYTAQIDVRVAQLKAIEELKAQAELYGFETSNEEDFNEALRTGISNIEETETLENVDTTLRAALLALSDFHYEIENAMSYIRFYAMLQGYSLDQSALENLKKATSLSDLSDKAAEVIALIGSSGAITEQKMGLDEYISQKQTELKFYALERGVILNDTAVLNGLADIGSVRIDSTNTTLEAAKSAVDKKLSAAKVKVDAAAAINDLREYIEEKVSMIQVLAIANGVDMTEDQIRARINDRTKSGVNAKVVTLINEIKAGGGIESLKAAAIAELRIYAACAGVSASDKVFTDEVAKINAATDAAGVDAALTAAKRAIDGATSTDSIQAYIEEEVLYVKVFASSKGIAMSDEQIRTRITDQTIDGVDSKVGALINEITATADLADAKDAAILELRIYAASLGISASDKLVTDEEAKISAATDAAGVEAALSAAKTKIGGSVTGDNLASKFLVVFTADGKVVSVQSVAQGGDATAPADPVVYGKVFKSWNGTYTNVTADVVITAVFEEATIITDAKNEINEWLDSYLNEILGNDSGAKSVASLSELEEIDLLNKLKKVYSDENAELILGYYREAITYLSNAENDGDVEYAKTSFKNNVAAVEILQELVDRPAQNGTNTLEIVALIILGVAILGVAIAVAVVSAEKKKRGEKDSE